MTAAVHIVQFHDIPHRRKAHEQHKHDKLSLAPNVDASSLDPETRSMRTIADLRTGYDACIGKLVQILKGPYKGYRGRVKCRGREGHFVVQMDSPRGMEVSFSQMDLVLVL